jgi:hypothetical protein
MSNEHDGFGSGNVRGYQFGLVVVIALIVSLAGGVVSSRLLAAQQPQPVGSNNPGELIVPPDGLLFKSPDGKIVAKLSFFESEGGRLTVYNSKGTSVAEVYSSDRGGVLGVFNNQGVPKLMLFTHEDSGNLGLYSKYGKLAIAMSGFAEGGNIGINSPSGDSVLTLEAGSKSGKLQITKPDGSVWSVP